MCGLIKAETPHVLRTNKQRTARYIVNLYLQKIYSSELTVLHRRPKGEEWPNSQVTSDTAPEETGHWSRKNEAEIT